MCVHTVLLAFVTYVRCTHIITDVLLQTVQVRNRAGPSLWGLTPDKQLQPLTALEQNISNNARVNRVIYVMVAPHAACSARLLAYVHVCNIPMFVTLPLRFLQSLTVPPRPFRPATSYTVLSK